MRWMTLAVVVLLFAQPGNSVAGPPEAASGKMVLDEVADGLRQYGRQKDPAKRMRWLAMLAHTKDPRVALALADIANLRVADGYSEELRQFAITALAEQFLSPAPPAIKRPGDWSSMTQWRVGVWLLEHEDDLRRRAKQLP